ncbi:LysR family transcriptional regulator [Halioxenophilus sp. WMMB6]|uniref:LysR family transcriptional regulator n=1 Tax=Halioxenophilus sp. WMMB6 TaxID=3073815 RepID=UPI00295E667E|nr:LysR family transcriptional regulator [Halioxenophilus sp. WMMB6]
MDLKSLVQTDLNLLVVLQVLLEEGSVSRAAQRLYLTQSAVSKALGRLRELYNDPLFTRSAQAMVPTPKALALQEQLPAVMTALNQLITPQEFNPATVRASIRMAVGEHAGIVLLPPLIERIQQDAPGLQLQALNRVEHQLDLLAAGELDFALHMQHQSYPSDFVYRTLLTSLPGLMVRAGHPLTNSLVSREEINQLKFVRLMMPDEKELEFLAQIDLGKLVSAEENTVFQTSHIGTAIEVVRRTDCVLPIPKIMAIDKIITTGMAWLQFQPFANYAINYTLVNHVRTENSPLHRWLAEVIQEVAAVVAGPQRRIT